MTVKEFSIKHDVPYNIVYNATMYIPDRPSIRKNLQYDEDELSMAVQIVMQRRIDRVKSELKRLNEIMEKCKM